MKYQMGDSVGRNNTTTILRLIKEECDPEHDVYEVQCTICKTKHTMITKSLKYYGFCRFCGEGNINIAKDTLKFYIDKHRRELARIEEDKNELQTAMLQMTMLQKKIDMLKSLKVDIDETLGYIRDLKEYLKEN